jgi:hypothetical protein
MHTYNDDTTCMCKGEDATETEVKDCKAGAVNAEAPEPQIKELGKRGGREGRAIKGVSTCMCAGDDAAETVLEDCKDKDPEGLPVRPPTGGELIGGFGCYTTHGRMGECKRADVGLLIIYKKNIADR